MKRILFWCLVAVASAGASDRPALPLAELKPLLRELLTTQAELYRQGAELQDWKIWLISGEFERAVAEQRRMEQEERALIDELTTPEGDSGEAGARRADISNAELPRLRESRSMHEQRVAELKARLAKERERRASLQQLADQAGARLRELEKEDQKETRK